MIDGIRRRFRPWFIVWITLMWCLLMGEFSWANFISGLLVGGLIVFGLPLPAMPIAGLQVHWWALLRYMVSWVRDLLVASVKVAWLALRPADPPKSAIVRVPMRVSNELVLSFATSLYNLQPGGAVSDIDIANRMWTVHLLDAGDERALAREIENVAALERNMIRIFERS
ncbi:Na+/H+ antiporter subunit E [Corynebacterium marinum]|uniref:Putative monovalent cation/H+ antiporter subunit E n=1 Tax=Corynebacterium marinum DSM 44953 TaxID=1224162 RepID=A0A0B6TPF4_9CORY|nr:Na+/H+ antiporter subunit E [Corynebacterium marinum]AJK69783.1 putative monovalent cation/H+ antiporter subunit E [Corynebacterium marinum DSM 44953]GGO18771.1 monovalent cation/H+ antiporter subunit E [Corynebacterium marinum]